MVIISFYGMLNSAPRHLLAGPIKKLFSKENYYSTQIFLSIVSDLKNTKTWPHGDNNTGGCKFKHGGEYFYGDDFSNGGLCWPRSIREGGGWDVYKSIWSENKLNRMIEEKE